MDESTGQVLTHYQELSRQMEERIISEFPHITGARDLCLRARELLSRGIMEDDIRIFIFLFHELAILFRDFDTEQRDFEKLMVQATRLLENMVQPESEE